ncbi:MAG TPA: ATP-binding protein, partial [Longimicrobiaceae bacterium]|nr:ATP-binding protein [Longimicrobiaceae bacterium]
LWDFLYKDERYRNRTVVVVDAEDLRNWGVTLMEDLSVERTIADFMHNVEHSSGPLASLAGCRCLVVKSPLGLIIHSRNPATGASSVNSSFLPYAVSGPISNPKRYGRMVGYSIILVAALAKGICWALSQRRAGDAEFESHLDAGVRYGAHLGLVLCEEHLRRGFIRVDPKTPPKSDVDPDPYGELFRDVAPILSRAGTGPATGKAAAPPGGKGAGKDPSGNGRDGRAAERKDWSKDLRIVSVDFDPQALRGINGWSRVRTLPGRHDWLSVEDAAIDVVRFGLEAVASAAAGMPPPWMKRNQRGRPEAQQVRPAPARTAHPDWNLPPRLPFPYARIGKLALVDRDEIDSFSHIGKLLQKYLSDLNWKRPLSIAVFGPPGSGKSFTVKQIIKSAMGDDAPDPLEFNLSQFQSLEELSNAFHQVQDRGLAAAATAGDPPPLVFFDEFDTGFRAESLGWLKYFLAPMQDGTFRDAHSTFRVGRAIFVFAGGICDTFHEFYGKQRESKEFRDAKGPDFVSRLRGHLNIQGINPGANSDGEVGEVGDLLMFRRAILLRAFLEESCPTIIDVHSKKANIHRGVICAFLRTRRYEHGVRSMEAVVQMSAVSLSRRQFQRSSVPSAIQLAMHVDAEEFLRHLQDAELEGDVH